MHRIRILLVEADPLRTPGLGRQLVQLGADLVASTTTPSEAVELCALAKPEIVLFDLPPAADDAAAAVIRALREKLALPVVILAARNELPNAAWMAAARPASYAVKPCSARRLEFALSLARAQRADVPAPEARFQQLARAVEQCPAAIVITRRDGCIEYVNPAFERVTGYSATEAIGANPRLLKSGTQTPEFYRNLWATLGRGETWTGEFHNRRRDGACFWEHASISPMRDAAGEITHFVAVKEDVTAQKQAHCELVRAREEAEAANRAKSSFLASMSHELRTPLNAIIGVTTALIAESAPPARREALEVTLQSGVHLLSLIEELLEYSSLQAGPSPLAPVPFDLAPTLNDILRQIAGLPAARHVTLSLALDPVVPVRVRGDVRRLRQILINLLGNAVKFTPGGTVHLVVRPVRGGTGLHFAVVDTGIGIPAASREAIFLPFQQADGSIRQRFGGTGLGLPISRAYVQQMGGELRVRSRVGRGSAFHFSIPCEVITPAPAGATPGRGRRAPRRTIAPLHKGPAPAPASPPDAGSADTLAAEIPLRILAADDLPTNRFVLEMVLRSLGYRATMVADGTEVIAALAGERYDLVVLDIQMPVMDGHAAAREIRRLHPDADQRPKLVALTADGTVGSREACIAAGMDGFLTKPLLTGPLTDCIRRLFPRPAPVTWLNHTYLDSFASNEPEPVRQALLRQLREFACADFRAMRPLLEAACRTRQAEDLRRIVHGMKGCFESLGWENAAGFCRVALLELKSHAFHRWSTLPRELQEHFTASEAALDEYLAAPAPAASNPAHHATV